MYRPAGSGVKSLARSVRLPSRPCNSSRADGKPSCWWTNSENAAARGEVDVVGQGDDRGPDLGRIDAAGRPVDGNPPFGQPGELLAEEERPARPGPRRVQQIAGEDEELRLFGQRGVEDPPGRRVGRLQQQFPQVIGHFGHAAAAAFLNGNHWHERIGTAGAT